MRGPALAVAADPRRVELAEAIDGLRRKGSEQRVVAAQQEVPRALCLGVGQHGVESREVAVDVVQDGEDAL